MVLCLLAISLAANGIGIRYALPSTYNASIDALHPIYSLDAADHAFSERCQIPIKYPRAHFLLTGLLYQGVLRVAYGPADGARIERELLAWLDALPAYGPDRLKHDLRAWQEPLSLLITAGRALSALMGTLLVFLLYRIARVQFGTAIALVVLAHAALLYPLVYYAHTLNLEVPYLFWCVLAFDCAIRAVHRSRPLLLLCAACSAAMAGATKDVAYAWLLFPMALLATAFVVRRVRDGGRPRARVAGEMLAFTAVAAVFYLVVSGLPFDRAGFSAHLAAITDPAFLEQTDVLESQLDFAGATLFIVMRSVGPVTLALAAAGAVVGLRRHSFGTALLLLGIVSQYATFIAPAESCFLRFVLPIAICAGVLASIPIGALLRSRRFALGGLLLALSLGPALVRTVQLDRLFLADPRPAATAFLEREIPDGARVAVFRDYPLHCVDVPVRAQVAEITADNPAPPADWPAPDYAVISFHHPVWYLREREQALPELPDRCELFGAHYALRGRFGPVLEHPILRAVPFQPFVLLFAREEPGDVAAPDGTASRDGERD